MAGNGFHPFTPPGLPLFLRPQVHQTPPILARGPMQQPFVNPLAGYHPLNAGAPIVPGMPHVGPQIGLPGPSGAAVSPGTYLRPMLGLSHPASVGHLIAQLLTAPRFQSVAHPTTTAHTLRA